MLLDAECNGNHLTMQVREEGEYTTHVIRVLWSYINRVILTYLFNRVILTSFPHLQPWLTVALQPDASGTGGDGADGVGCGADTHAVGSVTSQNRTRLDVGCGYVNRLFI